ncbi:MAG TPA: DUF2934 domain-containing protein [Steroidobacteraceae bacterium]
MLSFILTRSLQLWRIALSGSHAAYFRAERRGFAPGHELDDWLAAEREIDQLITSDGNA